MGMDTNLLSTLAHLSDDALLSRVKHLAAREREAMILLIAHLAELDERRLYLGEGFSSLFTYCTQVLHLSEHAAYGRIEVARAARRFPAILERLEEGSVTLTTVGLLAPHLTEANHRELLDAARDQSKRQVEELIARLHPQPPVPASIRLLPGPRRPVVAPSHVLPEQGLSAAAAGLSMLAASRPATSTGATRPAAIEPLAPERYKVQFTVSKEMYDKLRFAQALLRHQIPDGDMAAIFDRALGALLEELMKQKLAATDRPRGASSTNPHSRHIPAEVKRAVWARDGGRCAFVSRMGRRCTEEGFLEFHHVERYASGGEATVENIELRCRAHNGYEAVQAFGRRTAQAVREVELSYASVSKQPVAAQRPQLQLSAAPGSATRPGPSSSGPSRPPSVSEPVTDAGVTGEAVLGARRAGRLDHPDHRPVAVLAVRLEDFLVAAFDVDRGHVAEGEDGRVHHAVIPR